MSDNQERFAYSGPVIGLDGWPVPCQTPGCSRRAATKSLCIRHRGLPDVDNQMQDGKR